MTDWYTPAQLAGLAGMPNDPRNVRLRAQREHWPRRRRSRGKGVEYPLSCLPPETRAHLVAERLKMTRTESEEARDGVAAGQRLAVAARIRRRAAQAVAEGGLARAAALAGRKAERLDARLAVLRAFDEFRSRSGLSTVAAQCEFAEQYNAGRILIDPAVHVLCRRLSRGTLARWASQLKRGGVADLAGRYGNRKGTGAIDAEPRLRTFIVGMLADHPHCLVAHVYKAACARFADSTVALPHKRTFERWITAWKAENQEVFTALSNPDAWKSRYMLALGHASEDVVRLNQRWELDSTPADVMLTDGRHSVIGAIDIYSRRAKLLVAKTSKAAAIASLVRRALLDWGVPESVKHDNGQDYTSRHLTRLFQGLEVEQLLCHPFSGWEKPHIERFFRTFSHDLVELLAGYIGHNVAERNAIEARKSFAERLMTRGEVLDIRLDSAALQIFCDQWVDNVYHQSAHEGLRGLSPFERAAAWPEAVRRIEDERALDVLLAEAPGDGLRTVTKKGIRLDRFQYIAPELGDCAGQRVRVLYDPEDLGRIYVFGDAGFLCVAECPEVTGISRREIATIARKKQVARVNEARRKLRALAKKENTREIVDEILARRGAAASKLTPFPAPSERYDTDDLDAAGKAADALEELDNPAPPPDVDEAALQRVTQLMREDQRQDETAEDRFRRWIALQEQGAEGWSEFEHEWLRRYEQTPEFRGRHLIYEEFGPAAFRKGAEL